MFFRTHPAGSQTKIRTRTKMRRSGRSRRLLAEPLESRLLMTGNSWVVPTETPFSGSYTSEVDTDSFGNVYLATSVDGGAATGADLFLAKYLPSGVEDWSHGFPVPDNQAVWTATVGSDGFYVTGGFMGTMDFDPTEGEAVLSESAGRYYLAKYSLAGEFRWVRQFDANMRIQGLAAQDGDVYAVGGYSATNATFSVVRFSGVDGQTRWTQPIGTGLTSAISLHRPDTGPTHIYVAGLHAISKKASSPFVMELVESTDGSGCSIGWTTDLGQDFGNNSGQLAVQSEIIDGRLEPRIYVHSADSSGLGRLVKLDGSGNLLWWSPQIVCDSLLNLSGVGVEGGTAYLTGSFAGSVNFDQNATAATILSRGDRDGFIARYNTTDGQLNAVQRVGGGGSDSLQTLALANGWLLASGIASPPNADFLASEQDASGQIQMSAFVPVSPNELFTMRLDTAAPIVKAAATDIEVAENTPVTLSVDVALAADATGATVVWYEAGQQISAGNIVELILASGTHQITAIATDDLGRVGMAGVVVTVTGAPVNNPPVAVDDSYATTVDQVLTVATPGVLANDSDPDGNPISAVPVTGSTTGGGSVTLNSDGSFTYTPPDSFIGTDTFSYTITDGALTGTATISIEVREASVGAPLYVYDIRFESTRANKDWRAVFEIRRDSNGSGGGDAGDAPVAGVAITVTFAGQTYTGTTDADGVFRTGWIKNLSSGTHYANVVDLAMASYYWDMLMDLEDDSDGDDKPDGVLVR